MRIIHIIRHILNKLRVSNIREQRALRAFLSVDLRERDVAIDCGANVGNITEELCRHGATVYAFEPNPHAYRRLKERFSEIENVHCIPKGVYDRNDTVKLYLHENSGQDELHWSTGSSMLDVKNNVLKEKFVETPVVDLSEFVESLGEKVKILKLDVEGVECRIVTRLIKTGVIHKIDHVFVETHDHKTPSLKRETDDLKKLIKSERIKNVNLHWR
ncbi:MAG: FkbM family methyltransferase [Candidatus Latescibacterota bacterium]|jgi:FkbM family methyltransferase